MTDQLPTPRGADPLAGEITGGKFALFDFYRANVQAGGGVVISDRVFTDCLIEGPALMLVIEGVNFEGTNFGPTAGDLRSMLFKPMSGTRAIGGIPVRNCTFRNCQFNALGITGNDDLLQMLIEQVKTV